MNWTGFSLIGLVICISLAVGYLFWLRARVAESLAAPVFQIRAAVSPKVVSDGFTGVQEKYQPTFVAPDAEILIVDDNEMNLLIAKKLRR